MSKFEIALVTEQATEQFGVSLAKLIEAPLVVYLEGELGAGKTRLARAILHGLGHKGNVKSPTYTLVEPYTLDAMRCFHFDLYRLADPMELDFMGIRDYFENDCLCLIEWPEKGRGMIEKADLDVLMTYQGSGRHCTVYAKTPRAEQLLEQLKENL